MSVPKSERRPSDVEYVVKAQKIEQFFINYNNDEKTRILGLTDELVKLSIDVYNNATMFFEVCLGRVMGTLADKKKYCKKTYWSFRQLAAQMNILMAFRMEDNKPIKGLLIISQEIFNSCELLRKHLTKLNKEKN